VSDQNVADLLYIVCFCILIFLSLWSLQVLLVTTVGDIDVELWSKEAPKACRNFVQLCMEGYYDGTIFHRMVPDFIVQGGDPTGTGRGGESIYGRPFQVNNCK
jgi:cyclophilin family peptidyl-prolyl cis-trans isomerase